jgi:hypothetical protein
MLWPNQRCDLVQRKEPKSAIICFSRTGHSARLARKLEARTGNLIVLIEANRYPLGTIGFLRAVMDTVRNGLVLPNGFAAHLSSFDHLILCGPVWIGRPAAPLRAVLRSQNDTPQLISLFFTCGDAASGKNAIGIATQDLARKLTTAEVLPNAIEGNEEETKVINRFTEALDGFKYSPRLS